MAKAEEFRNEITSKIIAALENGTAPWQQPWRGTEAPYNAITKHQYNGINSVILSLAAMSMNMARSQNVAEVAAETVETAATVDTDGGENAKSIESNENTANTEETYGTIDSSNPVADSFFDQRWATYLQISNAGWHVRKGEKGTHVLLWKPNINTKDDGCTEITSVTQRIFTVFHASQIEGIPEYVPPEVNIIAAHEKAEKIILSNMTSNMTSEGGGSNGSNGGSYRSIRILFGGSRAFYSPSEDYIQVPHRGDFKSQEGFYSTVLHELVHATAHPSRLNREERFGQGGRGGQGGRYGNFSQEYAFEELVAEMGSLFIASSAGIPQSECEFQNHASYIESWLKSLRNDNMYIFRAAAEASKAAGYLLRRAGITSGSPDDDATAQSDKTDDDADGAGNQDGNHQE